MATTQRLGIDIVGQDKTSAAFASVDRKLSAVAKAANHMKTLFAAGVIGGALKSFVQDLIDVNKHAEPVAQSFTRVDRAWQAFALEVGSGGLQKGLVDFNAALSRAMVLGAGAADVLGNFLGQALSRLAFAIEVTSRGLKFITDNLQAFYDKIAAVAPAVIDFGNRLYYMMNPLAKAGKLWEEFTTGGASDKVVELMSTAGLKTDALTVSTERLDAQVAKLPKTFEEVAEALKKSGKAQDEADKAFQKSMDLVAKWRNATLTPLEQYRSKLQEINVLHAQGYMGNVTYARSLELIQDDFLKAGESMRGVVKPAKDAQKAFEEVSSTLSGAMTDAVMAVFDRTKSIKDAFKDMVDSILADLTRMMLEKAFTDLLGGLFGGGGGLLSGLFGGGGVAPSQAAALPAPAGFTGASAGRSALAAIPARAVNIKINDLRGRDAPEIETRQDAAGNTEMWIRAVNNVIGSGRADRALLGRFALRPMQTVR